jgi:hypothetical protein
MFTVIFEVLLYGNGIAANIWYIMYSNIDRIRERGRNRGRRKEDISVHVGWELVGRDALYLTCDEGKTKVRGWLYRS